MVRLGRRYGHWEGVDACNREGLVAGKDMMMASHLRHLSRILPTCFFFYQSLDTSGILETSQRQKLSNTSCTLEGKVGRVNLENWG